MPANQYSIGDHLRISQNAMVFLSGQKLGEFDGLELIYYLQVRYARNFFDRLTMNFFFSRQGNQTTYTQATFAKFFNAIYNQKIMLFTEH